MKKIPLGKFVLVDDEDYEWLSQYTWRIHKDKWNTYAYRREEYLDGRTRDILMHREIMGFVEFDGKMVDHKNRNGLDNRRENLREASPLLNSMNRKTRINNTSGYRGVCWSVKKGKKSKWRAALTHNGKTVFSKRFDCKEDAARAYDEAAKKIWGDDAVLNFPIDKTVKPLADECGEYVI
jgi:hypothetical protein